LIRFFDGFLSTGKTRLKMPKMTRLKMPPNPIKDATDPIKDATAPIKDASSYRITMELLYYLRVV
jgi:hypothetical protein